MEEQENLVRSALKRAASTADSLDACDAMRAVAAAALVVARCPGGEPTCPYYGPSDAMPEFPIDLRMLAVDALDQVVAEPPNSPSCYYEAVELAGNEWRQRSPASATPSPLRPGHKRRRFSRSRGRAARQLAPVSYAVGAYRLRCGQTAVRRGCAHNDGRGPPWPGCRPGRTATDGNDLQHRAVGEMSTGSRKQVRKPIVAGH